jgi:hypothetical protein
LQFAACFSLIDVNKPEIFMFGYRLVGAILAWSWGLVLYGYRGSVPEKKLLNRLLMRLFRVSRIIVKVRDASALLFWFLLAAPYEGTQGAWFIFVVPVKKALLITFY